MDRSKKSRFWVIFFTAILILKLYLLIFIPHFAQQEYFLPFLKGALADSWMPNAIWNQTQPGGGFPYGFVMGLTIWPLTKIFSLVGVPGVGIGMTLLVADLVLLFLFLRKFKFPLSKTLVIYWASPIILFVAYGHGQLDLIPMALLMWAMYRLSKGSVWGSGILLGCSIDAKPSVLLIAPVALYFIYLKRGTHAASRFVISSMATVFLMTFPLLQNKLYVQQHLLTPEVGKFFDVVLEYGQGNIVYLGPLLVIIVYLLFFRHRKINFDLALMYLGLVFTCSVLLSTPRPGWYLWPLPFMLLYLIKSPRPPLIPFLLINIFYLAYFIPIEFGFSTVGTHLSNVTFTGLQASLLLMGIHMYWYGIHSNYLYRERNTPFLIGVGGNSGSGKDTLTSSIRKLIGENRVRQINGDDDHRWERGDEQWKSHTHLDPKANKLSTLLVHVDSLRKGVTIARSRYDHDTGQFSDPALIDPSSFIVIQGLHPFYIKRMREIIDLKIFLDTDENLRSFWKIRRDVAERGHSKEDVQQNIERREEDSGKFIEPQGQHADLLIRYWSSDSLQGKESNLEYRPRLGVTYRTDNSLDFEMLTEYLESNGDTKVTHAFGSDLIHQDLEVGQIDPHFTFSTLAEREIDNLEELISDKAQWLQGISGLTQYLVLRIISYRLGVSE